MINLLDFKDCLLAMRDARIAQDRFNEVLDMMSPGNFSSCFLYDGYENMALRLLAGNFEGDIEKITDAIFSFVYDANGLENELLIVADKSKCPKDDKDNMLFYSADTLYEYIKYYCK